MSKRFEIHEIRTLVYTVEVPDSVTQEELECRGLDSEMFMDDYGGNVASWSDLSQYSVHPVDDDTDDYEKVVYLDKDLEEVETLEEVEASDETDG